MIMPINIGFLGKWKERVIVLFPFIATYANEHPHFKKNI
jgi:hypothetical protein